MITIRVFAKKKDATLVFNNLLKLDEKKGIAQLEFTNQMLALTGFLNLELVLYKGLSKFSTIPFSVEVIECINNENAVESTNEFTALQEALKTISSIDNKADKTYVDANINSAKASIEAILNPLKAKIDNNTLTFKRALGENENLNLLIETGLYNQNYNVNAGTGTNYPVSKAGLLIVEAMSGGYIYQTYHTFAEDNKLYTRGKYAENWSVWKEISTTSGFNMKDSSILSAYQLDIRKELNIKAYPNYGSGNCLTWLDGRQEKKRLIFDGIQEIAFDNKLVANGDSLVEGVEGYATLKKGWLALGGGFYLDFGWHDFYAGTNGGFAERDNLFFNRSDYTQVFGIIATAIQQDDANANLSMSMITVSNWNTTKFKAKCDLGYMNNPVRFYYFALCKK